MFLLRKSARQLHGSIDFNGLPISVENRMGSIRQWKNEHDGTEGITRMRLPYGYIKGTISASDKDHFDVFVGPHRDAPNVYIINQMKSPSFKEFDEQKGMLGQMSAAEAKKAYLQHYDNEKFFGSMITLPFEVFKDKVMQTRANGGQPIAKALQEIMDEFTAPFSAILKGGNEAVASGRFITEDELLAAAKRSVHKQINELLLGKTRAMTQMIEQEGRKLIAVAGGNPKSVPFDEFRRGYKVEQEHRDITGGDPVQTAKIVLAHLKERPDYYTRLEKYVEKAQLGCYLLKSHVKTHTRHNQSGTVTTVADYERRPLKEADIDDHIASGKWHLVRESGDMLATRIAQGWKHAGGDVVLGGKLRTAMMLKPGGRMDDFDRDEAAREKEIAAMSPRQRRLYHEAARRRNRGLDD